MGCSDSKPQPPTSTPPPNRDRPSNVSVTPATREKSSGIDAQLIQSKRRNEGKIKMLLLGAGESGKSTVFKQMRLLYGAERTDDDLRMYGVVVRSNIVVAIRKLCSLLRNLELEEDLEREEEGVKEAYNDLMAHLVDKTAFRTPAQDDPKVVAGRKEDWVGQSPRAGLSANEDANNFLAHHELIYKVWKSNIMRRVWLKRSMVNCVDAHVNFLNDIPRVASLDYRPTKQDVLISRVRTTQVVMEKFRIKDSDFEMYDVGGQRSDRRKWIDCFDEITAVIFVAALSEYDQTLAEAKRSNRMIEALELFRSVCNNRAFNETSVLLFLNKRDIFAEKIMYSDIADQKPFHDYTGPTQNFEQGVLYFIKKFKSCLMDDELNDTFIHVTCATDTSNMSFVLDSASTIIKAQNLKKSGFLGIE